jgi:hypothetical protein
VVRGCPLVAHVVVKVGFAWIRLVTAGHFAICRLYPVVIRVFALKCCVKPLF